MHASDYRRVEILENSSSTICAELSNSWTKTKVLSLYQSCDDKFQIQIKEICKYFVQEAIEA